MSQELQQLAEILKQHLGLDMQTVGQATIEKILNQRMRRCDIQQRRDYLDYLAQTPGELQQLLETAVIPETWFFRDTRAFPVILQHLKQRPPSEKFRLLCIPSSTGEEPYSLAMYFQAHQVDSERYEILAADISQRAIDIARQGIYTDHSFRNAEAETYRAGYFTQKEKNWQLSPRILETVSFHKLNILDQDALPYSEYFDCILCRNLLIYFDQAGRYQALKQLHRSLKADGLLFLGYSEFGILPRDLFQTSAAENAYALLKAGAINTQHKTVINKPAAAAPKARPPARKPSFKNMIEQGKPASAAKTATQDQQLLEARKLADAGQLQQAESLCLASMERDGPSEQAYYLLGLIHQSSEQGELAEGFYRKALFLNPKHYESLVQLACLRDQAGDPKGARLLRDRAARSEGNRNS